MRKFSIFILCLISSSVLAHGGGLDATGGHHNRQTGEYHCHREPCLSSHKQAGAATQEAIDQGVSFSSLYNRDDWKHWIDEDGDCQDTRAEILIRNSEQPVQFTTMNNCRVSYGLWQLPYTSGSVTNPRQLDIDHIIPLKWAHGHGGDRWSSSQKQTFANDPENLLPVSSSANRSKGAKGPDDWMPLVGRCEYATQWERLVIKYQLNILPIENAALLASCP